MNEGSLVMANRRGETTKIIKSLRNGGIFVWCDKVLAYPKHLAASIGRADVKVVGPEWLEERRYRGLELSDIVVDHSARLTDTQWNEYLHAKACVRNPNR